MNNSVRCMLMALGAIVIPALASAAPFTGKNEVCVGRASIATTKGVFVLVSDAKGPVSFQVNTDYYAWKDPVAALAKWTSGRDLLAPGSAPLASTPQTMTLSGGSAVWDFDVGANTVHLSSGRSRGDGEVACAPDRKSAIEALAGLLK